MEKFSRKSIEESAKAPPKKAEKSRALKNMSGVIIDELIGLQKRISKMPSALKEMLSPGKAKGFFERIFGKENKISSFLSLITTSLAEKFEFLNKI